ncbi:sensor histidine kinase [Sphingobacterium sp. MYb382]|uniref:sensor histidine kinase n=1 Tax=Sphingobacterium sp. MYb382 TaxID=2745278 RepID=UPI00309A38F8
MRCEHYDYPIKLWVQRSKAFALMTTGLIALARYTAGLMSMNAIIQTVFIFFIILFVALSNLFIHCENKVEDPIKSPLYVKLASFGSAIFVLFCFDLLSTALDVKEPHMHELVHQSSVWRNYLVIVIQACLLNFIVLLWLYFLMSDHFKAQNALERSRLEKSKEEAINKMLRQQIQPHFLFNALATLKSLMKKDLPLAEDYLLRLSDFLRITIAAAKTEELNSVQQEIKLCEDYLDMQKMRFNDALYYDIDLPESIYEQKIPFFSIQPLVDNALKHNSFTKQEPLHIEIKEEQGWLAVINKKNAKRIAVESNGSGLKNLIDRYMNYWPHGVLIEETSDCFTVKIKLL